MIREIQTRLMMAYHVLRGRPIAYRMILREGSGPLSEGALIIECNIVGAYVGES